MGALSDSAQAFQPAAAPPSAKYVTPDGIYDATAFVAASYSGKISLCRCALGGPSALAAVSFVVDTAVAAKTARVGIYSDVNGKPGALLLDAGTASLATIGTKDVAASLTLPAGIYWLAFLTDATATAVVGGVGASSWVVPNAVNSGYAGYSAAQAYGALPSALPVLAGALPVAAVFLKAA